MVYVFTSVSCIAILNELFFSEYRRKRPRSSESYSGNTKYVFGCNRICKLSILVWCMHCDEINAIAQICSATHKFKSNPYGRMILKLCLFIKSHCFDTSVKISVPNHQRLVIKSPNQTCTCFCSCLFLNQWEKTRSAHLPTNVHKQLVKKWPSSRV